MAGCAKHVERNLQVNHPQILGDMQKSILRASPLTVSFVIEHSGLEMHSKHINLNSIETNYHKFFSGPEVS